MAQMKIYSSSLQLPEYAVNMAVLLKTNATKFSNYPIFQDVHNDTPTRLTWNDFYIRVKAIQSWLLSNGFKQGDKMAFLSKNCQEMLEIELAVMALGGISVPIFSGYPADQANRLLEFCESTFVAVADQDQFKKIKFPKNIKKIIHFSFLGNHDLVNLVPLQT